MKAFLTLLSLLLCSITSRATTLEYRIFEVRSDTPITAMEMNRLYEEGQILPMREGSIDFTSNTPFVKKDTKTIRYPTAFDKSIAPTEWTTQDLGFTMSGRCDLTDDSYDVQFKIEETTKSADKIQVMDNGKVIAQPILSTKSLDSSVTLLSPGGDWIMLGGISGAEESTFAILLRIRE